jgi:uncharacterized iron-regulated membrane protein
MIFLWCWGRLQDPHPADSALVAAATRLEEAWAWGLDPDMWRAHLGPMTWPGGANNAHTHTHAGCAVLCCAVLLCVVLRCVVLRCVVLWVLRKEPPAIAKHHPSNRQHNTAGPGLLEALLPMSYSLSVVSMGTHILAPVCTQQIFLY